MEFSVMKVDSSEEVLEVDQFVHTHFMPDMPLAQAFGLVDNPPLSRPPVPPAASEIFRLKAVDDQGQIIGVAINKVNCAMHIDSNAPPQFIKMIEFLEFAEESAKLNTLPERTIELRILSVHKKWRQRGVARKLVEESVNEARNSGYKVMRICCTSEFTARLVKRLGWRELYRLAYEDYPTLSGKDVQLRNIPPHDHLYYFVTEL